jgi:hypothetical protein
MSATRRGNSVQQKVLLPKLTIVERLSAFEDAVQVPLLLIVA